MPPRKRATAKTATPKPTPPPSARKPRTLRAAPEPPRVSPHPIFDAVVRKHGNPL